MSTIVGNLFIDTITPGTYSTSPLSFTGAPIVRQSSQMILYVNMVIGANNGVMLPINSQIGDIIEFYYDIKWSPNNLFVGGLNVFPQPTETVYPTDSSNLGIPGIVNLGGGYFRKITSSIWGQK